jgi:PRC-barrel domain
MIRSVRTWTVLTGGLVLAGLALGQTTTDTRQVKSTTTIVHKGTVLTGATVVVQDGATIGKVEDFVITDGGCIEYVVVAYDSKYVFVPWTVMTWTQDRTVRVNVTREKFVAVPTFTRDRWPSLTETRYVEQVRTAFGVTESRFGDPNRRPPDRWDDAKDRREDRRDAKDQRKDVENPNRAPTTNPPDRSKDRRDDTKDRRDPPRRDESKDKGKDKDKDRPPDRPPQ